MEIINKNIEISKRLLMFSLALYPVLYSYVTSFNIKYCDLLFILVILIAWTICGFKNVFKYPRYYYMFWIYVAISLILVSHDFKVTYLIPGGIAFTIFSLNLGACGKFFDLDIFFRITKIVYILSLLVFVAQLLHLLPSQYQVSAILPISDHVAYSDVDYSTLMNLRDSGKRPSSFFLEPAYYAQFLLVYLALELFYNTRNNTFMSFSCLACVIILLLLNSGLGLVGLAILLAMKLFLLFKTKKKKGPILLVTLPLVIAAVFFYFSTEVGMAMLSRQEELTTEGTSGFLRVVQGFLIFDALPVINQIFGISMEDVLNMNLSFIFYNQSGDIFTNGLSTLLVRTGLIGTILLFVVYFFMWKEGSVLSKVLLLLLFVMSIIEQVYLSTSMLIISVISSCDLDRIRKR